MPDQALYEERRHSVIECIKTSPPTEISYYAALLVAKIEKAKDPSQHNLLLFNTQKLLEAVTQFYKSNEGDVEKNTQAMAAAYKDLVIAAKMNTFFYKIKHLLIGICSVVLSVFVGLIASLVGFSAGLFSHYTLIGNFKGALLGFMTGLAIGVLVGWRTPQKAFQDSFKREIEFGISSMGRALDWLNTQEQFSLKKYEEKTKQYILNTFFKDTTEELKEEAFQKFLNSEQSFQIVTTSAGHFAKALKRYLGPHALIRFKINGMWELPIQFGGNAKTPKFVDQYETTRVVSGQKLFDMLVLHHILQETHQIGVLWYRPGWEDCLTYINKILIGTGQAPTEIQRFNSTIDKWVANRVIAPLIRFYCPKEDIISSFCEHFKDANTPEIGAHKWPGRPEEEEEVEVQMDEDFEEHLRNALSS